MVNAGSFVHHVQGDFSDNGSFEAGMSEIVFSGSAASVDDGSKDGDFRATVCHNPSGYPDNSRTMIIDHPSVLNAHLGHGDTLGACPEEDKDDDKDKDGDSKDEDDSPADSGAAQRLMGDAVETVFHKLTMNNSNGLLLLHDAVVGALLDCSSGIIETGDNRVSISTIGSISNAGADSYVNGKLEKHFAAASPFTFAIGDAAAYTPVEVDFSSMEDVGSLTASTTAGDHPAITISDIDEEKSVNRYWTLSSSDITGVYDIVLHFPASDVDGGANSDNFVIRRLDEQTEIWNHVTLLAANPASAAGGGISASVPVPPDLVASGFGFFAIGESSISHFIRERELIYMQELYD